MAVVSQFLVSFTAVFLVVDPIGVLPIFLAITAGDPPEKIRNMALRACLAAGALLCFFALFGGLLFQVLGVTVHALKIAGGILLLVTALDMLRARESFTKTTPQETEESAAKDDVALVPLAIPLLSGPGAIATVMVLMAGGSGLDSSVIVLVSIILTMIASYFVLRTGSLLQRVLKRSGVAVLERVMGLILATIAVQFMADGVLMLLRG